MFPPKSFPPKSLKSVTKGVRNLESAHDQAATTPATPEPTADPTGLTCPQCGASFALAAVAKPSAAPAPPDVGALPQGADTGPAGGPGF